MDPRLGDGHFLRGHINPRAPPHAVKGTHLFQVLFLVGQSLPACLEFLFGGQQGKVGPANFVDHTLAHAFKVVFRGGQFGLTVGHRAPTIAEVVERLPGCDAGIVIACCGTRLRSGKQADLMRAGARRGGEVVGLACVGELQIDPRSVIRSSFEHALLRRLHLCAGRDQVGMIGKGGLDALLQRKPPWALLGQHRFAWAQQRQQGDPGYQGPHRRGLRIHGSEGTGWTRAPSTSDSPGLSTTGSPGRTPSSTWTCTPSSLPSRTGRKCRRLSFSTTATNGWPFRNTRVSAGSATPARRGWGRRSVTRTKLPGRMRRPRLSKSISVSSVRVRGSS